jgi:diguanylate cyclase (GGDEF)-like protein
VIPTFLVIAALSVAAVGSRAAYSSDAEADTSAEIVRSAAIVLVETEFAESAQRGFLLTGRQDYLDGYSQTVADIPVQLRGLQTIIHPAQRPLVIDVESAVRQKIAELDRTITLRRTDGEASALKVVNSDLGRRLTTEISAKLQLIDDQERRHRANAERVAASAHVWTISSLAVGAAAALALLALLTWLSLQRRRLDAARRSSESARLELVDELSQLATHDALTGLPNRRLATDRLERALLRTTPNTCLAVLFVDLDRFKHINDQHGHLRGDDVLVDAARRMRDTLHPNDTLARVGGDEFIAICEGLPSHSHAMALAERLRDAIRTVIDGISLDASVGVALHVANAEGDDPMHRADRLIDAADVAMYAAKEKGRGRVVAYDSDVAVARGRRQQSIGDLAAAFDAGQLWIAYQPVIDLSSDEVVGLEALLRWTQPDGVNIPPDAFIPVAEQSGLIIPIGEFVLRTACAQTAEWNVARAAAGVPPLSVAVNVSGRQLSQRGFVATVRRTLAETQLPANCLCLEITETALIESVTASAAELQELSDLGLRIALDDFGTGYSSLSYLRRFPIDVVKIDRSFVAGVGRNDEDTAIVSAVVGLAHSLNLGLVAEGIEHAGQAKHLSRLGCLQGQGFLFAKPLPSLDIEAFLLNRTSKVRRSDRSRAEAR